MSSILSLPPKTPPEEPDGAKEFEYLRELLLSPERRRLAAIEAQLSSKKSAFARDVARILPEAIRQRTANDDTLSQELAPIIHQSLIRFVEQDAEALADTLYPIMGPAIRTSISDALRRMVQNFNDVIDRTLSWQSFGWRIEALRTGQSFGQVVLMRTLLYRVEQAFFVEHSSGLLLGHTAVDGVEEDADMISAMLAVVRDYVQDSFQKGTEDIGSLHSIAVGDLTVWVEQGRRAILALVIRGNPPANLRKLQTMALERFEGVNAESLRSFDGDIATLRDVDDILEGCLLQQQAVAKRPAKTPFILTAAVVVLGLMFWGGLALRDAWRRDDFLRALRIAPGVQVTDVFTADGLWHVHGLRDPAALDPTQLLAEMPIEAASTELHFEPYDTLEPAFVLDRARRVLQPPSGVEISYQAESRTLLIQGRATRDWANEARLIARGLSGVEAIDDDGLITRQTADVTLKQAILLLNPPEGVTLDLVDGTLMIRGTLTRAELRTLQRRGALIDGVDHVDIATAQVVD